MIVNDKYKENEGKIMLLTIIRCWFTEMFWKVCTPYNISLLFDENEGKNPC